MKTLLLFLNRGRSRVALISALLLLPSLVQANTYRLRTHQLVFNKSGSQTLELVRTSGWTSEAVYPQLVSDSHFQIIKNVGQLGYFAYGNDISDSVRSIEVYFYTSVMHETTHGLLLVPMGSSFDTVYLTGTDETIQPKWPNGPCYSLSEWGRYLTLGSLDSTHDTVAHNVDFSYDWGEAPGQATILASGVRWIHLKIVGSDAWYLKSQPRVTGNDSLGLGSASPKELYTTGNQHFIGYHSIGVRFDTALLISETIGGCVQRDTNVLYFRDNLPQHIWQKLAYRMPNIGTIAVGDTGCGNLVLKNTVGFAVTVDSLVLYNYYPSDDDWIYTLPSMPITLAAGDSLVVPICYHATEYNRTTNYGYAWPSLSASVYYHNADGLQGKQYDFAHASTPQRLICAQDTLRLNDVMVGGYVDAQITIYHQDDSVHAGGSFKPFLWTDPWDSLGEWHIVDPLGNIPLTQFDTIPLKFEWVPPATGDRWALLILPPDITGTVIIGRAVENTTDSLDLNAPPEHALLAFRSDQSTYTRTFYFRNNSGASIKVDNVSVSDGTHFRITGMDPTTLPATLSNGDLITVTVEFDGDTTGFYHDSLIVVTSNAARATVFDLQAVRTLKASAPSIVAAAPELTVAPVPMDQKLTLSMRDVQSVRYQIFDLIGTEIANIKSTGTSNWSATNIAAGTYIVRASGLDADGHPFVTSRRFVKR